jgi:hypothetical protein
MGCTLVKNKTKEATDFWHGNNSVRLLPKKLGTSEGRGLNQADWFLLKIIIFKQTESDVYEQ